MVSLFELNFYHHFGREQQRILEEVDCLLIKVLFAPQILLLTHHHHRFQTQYQRHKPVISARPVMQPEVSNAERTQTKKSSLTLQNPGLP
jgi:hypothetical protein